MTVSVVVPYRAGCEWRARAWKWVQARYRETHPDWQLVTGSCSDGPFNRAEAILDGAGRTDGDVLVVADADVWCDAIPAAVEAAEQHGWAVPHRLLHRLSPESTEQVLAGADWRGLPLSTDNGYDMLPRVGNIAGTLIVLRRDVLHEAPPDVRFVGWGQEDDAWKAALGSLAGKGWRGDADLVHLWHPPQPRQSRGIGSETGRALAKRYQKARNNPTAMRALIAEVNA